MGNYVYVADSNVQTLPATTVATTATRFATAPMTVKPKNVVRVMAPTTNTASIFIGSAAVTTATGIELVPGAYMDFYVRDPYELYGIVAAATQNARTAAM